MKNHRTRSNSYSFQKEGIVIKKLIALVLVVVAVCAALYGCSNSADDTVETSAKVTAAPEVPTEEAVIKASDAIHYIEQSYTKEELGLEKVEKEYSMMVASNGVDIDGDKYIKVVANVIVRNDTTNEEGKETFSMESVGEYFISFDAKTVLMKDQKSGEYVELENRYDEFVSKNQATSNATTAHEH